MNNESEQVRREHATKAGVIISLSFVVSAGLTYVIFVPAMHWICLVWLTLALIFAGLALLVWGTAR